MADRILEAKYVTEEALLALPSDARVEVVNGEIVEMSPVGAMHVLIAANIYRLLYPYVTERKLGYVFTDSLIFYLTRKGKQLFQARIPDLSFVHVANIPKSWEIEKPFPSAPTLAVEVFSPNDDEEELLAKTREFLRAGTEQVWLIYPRQKEVHQYKRGESVVQTYSGDAALTAEELFPGLSLPLADVFALPDLSRQEG